MKTKKDTSFCKRYLIFILLIPILNACIEDVNLKDLNIEPKMVLFCYISPMFDTNKVYLTNSQPLLSSNADELGVITNAKVQISTDSVNWVSFTYHLPSERYILPSNDFPIEEGKTYYIRATAPGFDEMIRSSCKVPVYRDINIKIDTQLTVQDYYKSIIFNFSWKDFAGEQNYYYVPVYDTYEEYYFEKDTMRSVLYSNPVYNEATNDYVFSDEKNDGKILKGNYSLWIDEYQPKNYDTLRFNFVQMDKIAYMYWSSLIRYYGSISFMGIVEPVILYNNIENGYGLFSAFVFKTYRFVLKDESIEEY